MEAKCVCWRVADWPAEWPPSWTLLGNSFPLLGAKTGARSLAWVGTRAGLWRAFSLLYSMPSLCPVCALFLHCLSCRLLLLVDGQVA